MISVYFIVAKNNIMKLKLCFAISLALFAIFFVSCSENKVKMVPGVSKELALARKDNIDGITYSLHFSVPRSVDSLLYSRMEVEFSLGETKDVLLDFKPSYDYQKYPLNEVYVNGHLCDLVFEDEHLVVPAKYLLKGKNIVKAKFVAGEQSLNRRVDIMYTLLVPDRARTLFPCFDQPDLKAKYNLSLQIPDEWEAVANGKPLETSDIGNGFKKILFSGTEPIPTYLFSFVVGDLNKLTETRDGREVNLWHMENDPDKLSQTPEVFSLVYGSLEWLEDYTGIEYPFTKYDIVVLPGFQYGGMEHMGATLYADRTMFLEPSATITEHMSRAKLVAHETAHMWFGDYVTMKWFDDVWTKEVFANWFASKIVSPMFEDINHRLNFLNTYYPAAYAEDRSLGANPVQQELSNLQDAGLVYGNIIYNKAPIVMDKLVSMIGDSLFKEGIREYLKSFAYGNATWDDLIDILDARSQKDLHTWSNVWIKEKGRADIYLSKKGDSLVCEEVDPFGRGLSWGDSVSFELVPDPEGNVYGLIIPDSLLLSETINNLKHGKVDSDVARLSAMINLYELVYKRLLEEEQFLETIAAVLSKEDNPLVFSRLVGYLSSNIFASHNRATEAILKGIYTQSDSPFKRSMAFKAYVSVARSQEAKDELSKVWENPDSFEYVSLGQRDLMDLSYKLALLDPDSYLHLLEVQSLRLSSSPRLAEFRWVFPSLSPSEITRDSVFNSLLEKQNRSTEPWAAQALGFLNHEIRSEQALDYILPGLEVLEEVHYTGDIFFPARWCSALLSGHSSDSAYFIVNGFLERNRDYNPLLKNKILQQSQHLSRK
jgi:aminopeptidase N